MMTLGRTGEACFMREAEDGVTPDLERPPCDDENTLDSQMVAKCLLRILRWCVKRSLSTIRPPCVIS